MKKVFTILLMVLAIMTVFVSCDDAPHVHQFSSDWSHDDTYHWHPATCGDTEEVDSKGEHVWDYKTAEDKAKHIKTCKTCGYSLEEEHKNEYKLTEDKAKHYQVCTLCEAKTEAGEHSFTAAVTEDKTKHQESCVCGYKKEAESHIVENWTIDKDSTEDEEGEKHGNCTVCNYLVRATIDMKEHTHKESKNYGYDGNNHWYKCTKAGCSYKFSEGAHSLTYVKDDADGHYQKCACGYTTEKKDHDFKYVVSEDGAYHQQKCETCGYSTLETDHTYKISDYDNSNHWNKCVCGKEDTKSAHTYSSDAVVKDGKAVKICDTCKYENAVTEATITVKDEKALTGAVNAEGVSTVKFGGAIEVTSNITVSQSVTIDMNNCVMTVNDGSITAGDGVVVTVKNISRNQEVFDIEGTEAALSVYSSEGSDYKVTYLWYPTLKGAIERALTYGDDTGTIIVIQKNLELKEEIKVNKRINIMLIGSLEGEENIKLESSGSICVNYSEEARVESDLAFGGAVARTTPQGEEKSTTYCPSLDIAIKTAKENDTVKLLADVSLSSTAVVEKSINLALNGKTISGSGTVVSVKGNNVNVTITGDGEIKATDGCAVEAIEDATVTIKGGKYSGTFAVCAGRINRDKDDKITNISDGHVVIESGEFESTEFTVPVWGTSSAEIKGGTFTATDNAVIGTNGSPELSEDNYTITITGGTFNGSITTSGYIACGIFMANSGAVNVSGGTFNITGGIGILVRSGTLNATKGTITLKEKDGLTKGWVGDSKTEIKTGSQIVVDKEAKYPGWENINVTNSARFAVKNAQGNDYSGSNP